MRLCYFSLGQTIKNSSGQMRQPFACDANESTRRLVEGGMSTRLTNMPTARGFFVLYHVFITLKQCILCSVLRDKSYLTLPCVNRFKIFSALELSCKALFGCRLAPSRLRRGKLPLLISNSTSVGSLTSPSI